MVNNDMTQDAQKNQQQTHNNTSKPRRPNESGAFSVEAHVRISDPVTKEIFVEKRA